MLTRIGLAPRATGLTIEQFQDHWRHTHADEVSHLAGLRRYVQNHAVLDGGHPLLPYLGIDACSEIDVDDLAAMDEIFGSATYQEDVRADEKSFVDQSRFTMLLGQRRILIPAEAPVKLLSFLPTWPGVERSEVARVLEGEYADTVRAAAGVVGHEQYDVLESAHAGRNQPVCDFVDVLRFATVDAAHRHILGPSAAAARAVLVGYCFGVERLLAEEVTVIGD